MFVVEFADLADPVEPVTVTDPATQRIAGVSRVGDEPARPEHLHHLGYQPRLRVVRVDVEILGHCAQHKALAWVRAHYHRSRSRLGCADMFADAVDGWHGAGIA